jgi:hypothetical protein
VNIFALDPDPRRCAQAHANTHVVKMPTEMGQMMSTALRGVVSSDLADSLGVYRVTHPRHPSTLWVGETRDNWLWGTELLAELCAEYRHRYGRHRGEGHATARLIPTFQAAAHHIPPGPLTPWAMALPDDLKRHHPVLAYRHYYVRDKAHLLKYRDREPPFWITTLGGFAQVVDLQG